MGTYGPLSTTEDGFVRRPSSTGTADRSAAPAQSLSKQPYRDMQRPLLRSGIRCFIPGLRDGRSVKRERPATPVFFQIMDFL